MHAQTQAHLRTHTCTLSLRIVQRAHYTEPKMTVVGGRGCWQLTFSYQTCYALPLIVTHSCIFAIFPVNFNENLTWHEIRILIIIILRQQWGFLYYNSLIFEANFIPGLQHISDSGCLLCIYVVTVTRIFVLEYNVSKRKHQKQYPQLSIML